MLSKGDQLEAEMDISDIVRLNELWHEVYPYLSRHAAEYLPENAQRVLEIGPFSGGITFELASQKPQIEYLIGVGNQEIWRYLNQKTFQLGLEKRVRLVETPMARLEFVEQQFDFVIFRGAFFFLDEQILQEIFRVMRKEGKGFVGGGYGCFTPGSVIDPIAEESKELNYKLGKKWVSKKDVEEMLTGAGLQQNTRILEQGGLWVIINR